MTQFRVSFLILLLLVAVNAKAQKKDDLNKEVQVTRAYDPILSDANKIDLAPQLPDSLFNIVGGYQYNIDQRDIVSNFALRPIQVARLRGQAYQDPKWLYARLGIGYPLQPLVDIYANNIQPDNLSIGMFYNHRSIWAKIANDNGDKIPIDEMQHKGAVFARKHFNSFSIGAQVGIDQHSVLFYGYDTEKFKPSNFTFNKDSLRQVYTSIFANIDLESKNSDIEKIRYKLGVDFQQFGDNGSGRFDKGRLMDMDETTIGGSAYLGKAFAEGQHLVGLELDGRLFNRKLSFNEKFNQYPANNRDQFGEVYHSLYGMRAGADSSDTRLYLNVFPSYTLQLDQFRLKLGLQLTAYKIDSKMQSKAYPRVDASYKVATEFIPFAQLEGGLESNSYSNIAALNPYIAPGLGMTMRPTDRSFELKAGARGKIDNYLSYQVYGQYKLYKDKFYFINSTQAKLNTQSGLLQSMGNNFVALYDDTQELVVGGDIQFRYNIFQSKLHVAYHKYMLDELKTAYHLPSVVLNWENEVVLENGLKLSASLGFESERPYMYTGTEELKLSAIAQLGLGAEYMINRNFSVFLQLDNLLNQKYQRWYQYTRPGISAVGGITFKL